MGLLLTPPPPSGSMWDYFYIEHLTNISDSQRATIYSVCICITALATAIAVGFTKYALYRGSRIAESCDKMSQSLVFFGGKNVIFQKLFLEKKLKNTTFTSFSEIKLKN